MMSIQPEACVVFEDAIAGVQAAINGNMKAVGVGKPEILTEADLVIPGFKDFGLDRLNQLFQ